MLAKLARGAFLLILTVMVVAWAVTASTSKSAEPQNEQPIGYMYS